MKRQWTVTTVCTFTTDGPFITLKYIFTGLQVRMLIIVNPSEWARARADFLQQQSKKEGRKSCVRLCGPEGCQVV